MALAQVELLTAEDYRLLPEAGPRYQLVEGRLLMAPAPNRFHQDISRNLEYLLLQYLEKHPAGRLYHAPFDVYLGETNVYQPDILFVASEREHILTDAGAEGAPNLIVEILSPKTARLDLHPKRLQYAQQGVEELWIIDPVALTISIYRFAESGEPVAVTGAEESFTTPQFPGLVIEARRVFAR